jgi:ketosteroid isomerase-like protein
MEALPSTPEEAVKAVLTQRIEGIKKKDAEAIMNLVDKEKYTKFDDWPPFERQGSDALNLEAEALKVLKEYNYEIGDWRIDIFNNSALASFTINYRGKIRDLSFNIKSRVTAFLTKKEERWRIVHEHWSRFPQLEKVEEKAVERRRRFPF